MASFRCGVCNANSCSVCASCKSSAYCSKVCQPADWQTHKLLCRNFRNPTSRPSPSSVLVICLPARGKKPELAWVDREIDKESHIPERREGPNLAPILGKGDIIYQPIIRHRAEFTLNRELFVAVQSRSLFNNRIEENQSVTTTVNYNFNGPTVLLR